MDTTSVYISHELIKRWNSETMAEIFDGQIDYVEKMIPIAETVSRTYEVWLDEHNQEAPGVFEYEVVPSLSQTIYNHIRREKAVPPMHQVSGLTINILDQWEEQYNEETV